MLPEDSVRGRVFTLASGTALAQLITAGTAPIVTRLYSPDQIGLLAVFMAFFGLWSSILAWRYESALLIATDRNELRALFQLAATLTVIMSVMSAPILYGLMSLGFFGFHLLPGWCAVAAVPIHIGYGFFMLYRACALRAGIVRQISKAAVTRSAFSAVSRVLLGLAGVGAAGLFAAEIASAWAAMGALRGAVRERYGVLWSVPGFTTVSGTARRYAKFGKYEMPSVVINQLALVIPVPLIAAFYGAAAAGWFGLARILVALPNAQVGRAVSDVFQMELSQSVKLGDRAAARRLFYRLLRRLSLLGLLPMTIAMTCSPTLVPFVFGREWAPMGIIAALIAPWIYATLVVSSLSRVLSVLQRQEYKLIYDVSALSLICAAFGAADRWSLGLMATVSAVSAVGVVSYLIYLGIIIRVVSRDLCAAPTHEGRDKHGI